MSLACNAIGPRLADRALPDLGRGWLRGNPRSTMNRTASFIYVGTSSVSG